MKAKGNSIFVRPPSICYSAATKVGIPLHEARRQGEERRGAGLWDGCSTVGCRLTIGMAAEAVDP